MITQIHPVPALEPEERHELFRLFDRFYLNTDEERFLADLAGKDWVFRMREGGRLVGFSTQQSYPFAWRGGEARVLFSGDTIVHPDFWDRSQLAGAFGHLFLRLLETPGGPLYWFLISKGFRTYRFLPVFFQRFAPRHDGTDSDLAPLLAALAADRFGEAYDAETGVIDFGGARERARDSVAAISPQRASDPHIAFFARTNPRHMEGTELACLAPLSVQNLTRCGRRVIERTRVEWHDQSM